MRRKLAQALVAVALLGLASAPVASAAIGVANHRAVKRADRAANQSGLAACPQQDDLAADPDAQQRAMRCMIDLARQRAGLAPLADSAALDLSTAAKTSDLLTCDSFSHEACGRPFSYWIGEVGYTSASCWHVGENLAWGTGADGTVHSIFRAWMRSPGHRRNILGDYAELGLDLEIGELEGQAGARVWTAHFGAHC
jgi:uncharacterized protein YkwD